MSHADTHRCKLMARLADSLSHSFLAQVVVLKDKKGETEEEHLDCRWCKNAFSHNQEWYQSCE